MLWSRTAGLFIAIVAGYCHAASIPEIKPAVVPPELASPYRAYSLKATSFVPAPGRAGGLLLKARIDAGPPLRLLLDSGAEYIVLDKKTAARSGYISGPDLDLVGAGSGAKRARTAQAASVEIADLALRNCRMVIVENRLSDGIDGVIPLALFAGFSVRLDVHGKTLELSPYAPGHQSDGNGFVRARVDHNILFLKTVVNESQEGYAVLDTGASYNAISHAMSRALKAPRTLTEFVTLRAGVGETEGIAIPFGIRFRLGDGILPADQVVAVDLSTLSRYHQFAISALIGYPALSSSVLMINYRDALVRIDPR
jgi:predicted aspartyl protease